MRESLCGIIPFIIFVGVTVDVTKSVQRHDSSAVLKPDDLEKWERDHGRFPENSVILVRFGWSKYYHNKTVYMGIDKHNGKLNFPGKDLHWYFRRYCLHIPLIFFNFVLLY